MPYIDKEVRENLLSKTIGELAEMYIHPDVPGELNYVISELVWRIFDRKPNYTTANALVGALESAKLEFYRRKVAPYEDQKIVQNGDL